MHTDVCPDMTPGIVDTETMFVAEQMPLLY
jgi:hypothetical protein